MNAPENSVTWTDRLEYSEALDQVMEALSRLHQLEVKFEDFLRVHAVVDTNVIYADLRYMLRYKPGDRRRPAIFELLAKRTIIGFFPIDKVREVEDKCLEMAERYGVHPRTILELWEQYKKVLRFVPTAAIALKRLDVQTLAARDPTDLAFLQARHAVGASVIVTNDPDIIASGAPVASSTLQVFLDLRHYSRQQGLMAAVKLGTGMVVMAPIAAVIAGIHGLSTLIKKIPREALYAIAGVIGVALLFPSTRKFLVDTGKVAWQKLNEVGEVVIPVLVEAYAASEKARVNATAIRPRIDQELEKVLRARRLTLGQAVFRACALADSPLSVQEVWDSAVRDGAKSNAKNPLTSVRRALKAHPLLKPIADGRWQVATLQQASA